MELRQREAARQGRKIRRVQQWVPYSRISPYLKRAVVVAEDGAFWDHDGIDVAEIRKSIEDSFARRQAPRGASTITQQLAKNLYLSPSYDPLRKIRELIIARRLEVALSKARIFEIYLNVIEWGDGVWGAEAASRTYFGIPASALTPSQAALLAGAIINPRVLSPARPQRRLVRRQRIILTRMGALDSLSGPAVETDVEPAPGLRPHFPLTVDQEEAQAGEDTDVPDEPEPEPPVVEIPPN
jgi:monofunctional biosynthetic peptidoglycan transglycosylase